MKQQMLSAMAKTMEKKVPEIRPGYTVRVHQRVQEGDKERVQIFEGLVISVHMGHTTMDRTFTVRRIVSGVGVERIFAVHSPLIDKIEVKKVAKVRRANLSFLRGRTGKRARISERFTNADEFAIAAAPAPVAEVAAEEAPAAAPEAKKEEKAAA